MYNIYPLTLEPPFHPTHPTPLYQHRALNSTPSSRKQFATNYIFCTWSYIYDFPLSIQLTFLFPPTTLMTTCPFSTSVSLFLCQKYVHLYYIFQIPYMCIIYGICFSLSDLTCLLKNLYAVQEATVSTGLGTTAWLQIGKGVHKDCTLSP